MSPRFSDRSNFWAEENVCLEQSRSLKVTKIYKKAIFCPILTKISTAKKFQSYSSFKMNKFQAQTKLTPLDANNFFI